MEPAVPVRLRCPRTQPKTNKRFLRLSLSVAAVASGFAGSAFAGETAATNFPLGVNTALPALYPPAGGTEFYNYDVLYTSSRYNADAGNPNPPSFHTNVFVEAFRINHTWINITPGITLGSGLAFNFVSQSVGIAGNHSHVGIGWAGPDIIPYNLSFQVTPTLAIAQIFNYFTGSGSYDSKRLANAGLNYQIFEPELALSYLPAPAWEIGLDARVGFNTRNSATRYLSGNDFTVDYVAGYWPIASLPAFQVGVQGYFYKQIADDTLDGTRVGNGNRGQAFAIRPSFRYDIGHGGLVLKFQRELAVEDRPQGDRIWFQFALPL